MKRHFVTLDGCRGIAAIMVALSHATEWTNVTTPPFAFLALDFFFMLSGFVISFAYEDRLVSTMPFRRFLKLRIVRLHPLILLGAVAGAGQAILHNLHHGTLQPGHVALLFVLGVILFPFHPSATGIYEGRDSAFPLNGPTWSMFAEYGINILYAAIVRHLGRAMLVAIIVASGAGVIAVACRFGTLSFGFAQDQILFALVRVCCPFFIGVALCRLYLAGSIRGLRLPMATPGVLLFLVLAMPAVVPAIPYALLADVVILPAIMIAGIGSDPDREAKSRFMAFMGRISYPLYAIHAPILLVLAPIAKAIPPGARLALVVAMVAVVVIAASFVERYYDAPVRRWFAARRTAS